ncbi:DUF935 domain-containing protein [Shewanella sp. D64]|uniref:DUF935 domain-containing protein n=1 Tax=unclassified Shewanella TaxID=196818 RepID=UPI0022BA381A|nr:MULTISPECIES: DUF935 domain-containing protein [unclassified Shewanella]MEC4724528.1 DUF935 domain-containing protein [Shewanella sp. D64]MEC4736695.1 DUF935 domain-containing protein [Shewanella sp. E94]WBJ94636.1 DUF935 domain-containing protein [Shewanella sp. MTB7]
MATHTDNTSDNTLKSDTHTDKNGTRFTIKQNSSKALAKPQTDNAKLGHLHSHYAQHPSRGLTPAKLARILVQAEQGDLIAQCELAEDMEEKDGHIFSELQKRRRALLDVEWQIMPPRNASAAETKDAEMLAEQLEDMQILDDLIFDMSDAILKGFSNSEIVWQQQSKLWLPTAFNFKDPSWFMTGQTNANDIEAVDRNELRLRDNTLNGAALQRFGWISHVHKTKSGYLGRNGLGRVLAWPFLFKNYGVRDLAEFLEIYGLPLRLGKYPTGADKSEKATLLRAVMSIGHNAGGIIPKGMEIDFKEAAKGNKDPFEYMISLMEKTISKAILGGTLTSQADGKSSTNALGNVHNEVRQELRDSDLKQIGNTLTCDLVLPMYMLNGKSYRTPNRSPRLVFNVVEAEDLKGYAESLPKLVDIGFAIPQQWAQDKLQIPVAQDNETVLAKQVTAKPVDTELVLDAQQAKLKKMAIKRIVALKSQQEVDTVDLMSATLQADMSPILEGFTDEVRQLVEGANSLEDLQQSLSELNLSIDEASEVLQLALVTADLAGQHDVNESN